MTTTGELGMAVTLDQGRAVHAGCACASGSWGRMPNQMAYMAGRNTRVSTVPAKVPPIRRGEGAPEHGMRKWDERQDRRQRGEDHRPSALHGGFDHGAERIETRRFVLANLPDQDQRVTHEGCRTARSARPAR